MRIKIIKILTCCMLLTACHQTDNTNENSEISKRDYSININNSFNDLFLDSNAVEKYFIKKKVEEEVVNKMRSFYNTRNYQFAWFSAQGIAEQGMIFMSIRNISSDTLSEETKLHKDWNQLLNADPTFIKANNPNIIQMELRLTQNLISSNLLSTEEDPVSKQDLEKRIPVKKMECVPYADSLLLQHQKKQDHTAAFNPSYTLLFDQLARYTKIVKQGGLPQLNIDLKKTQKGNSYLMNPELIKWLYLTNDLDKKDTSLITENEMEQAIKQVQSRLGFTSDGKITPALLHSMNISATERLQQILINLERMRWLPHEINGKLIAVNIPSYNLSVYEENKKQFSMPVVVGKEGHNTILFSNQLTTIVFSPYWNVPASIVKSEMIAAIAKDKNYLQKHDMEITGNENGLPAIRQKPGVKNALGKVKFLFPNIFDIYFHDTPTKSLFDKDVRAFSHGCIRLSDPKKLAQYLLQSQPEWNTNKIVNAMNSKKELYVSIKEPVPVLITYYTAWVDENNLLQFRDDIYNHDQKIVSRMLQK